MVTHLTSSTNPTHASLALFSSRSLVGETAYITGASAGIGKAVARILAALGVNLVLGARRLERLQDLAQELRQENAAQHPNLQIFPCVLDVTQESSIADFFAEGAANVGPCSILINNAGLARGVDKVHELEGERVDEMLDTNVRGAIAVTTHAVKTMRAHNHGDVVFLASVAGSDPYAGGSVYCATKAALHAFAQALRHELLGSDVRTLVFDPGMVETEFSQVRFFGDKTRAEKVYEGVDPLWAEDIADCIAFALTRPRRMSLDKMLILAQAQVGTRSIHRR